jgi:aminopeptidase N
MLQSDNNHETVYRTDYRAPDYLLDRVSLHFELEPEYAIVRSKLNLQRNPESSGADLALDGTNLELLSISLNGETLNEGQFSRDDLGIRFPDSPDHCVVEITVKIYPARNTALEGLYQSGAFLLTQCEAEGFRNITYYPDRPDVMARFDVTIDADRELYPVLLSNGNQVERGDSGAGRHWVRWEDPFPKPSYLFALVAGRLSYIEDFFETASGRRVTLRVYVEEENIEQCGHAMASLIKSMAWDEKRFGLEYDLDVFNIVATNDFNMGAMENKSLNIFNSKFVLALPETATDANFQAIEGVIGHEYFHNWTGNRVTCQDWFQLTLKEGLTVYRDQEFSSDMQSRAVKRIQDVRSLRQLQYAEDAGPMSHPVRPDQYLEINNFYTVTVYEKGAEVVRMYETLLGRDGFRKGMDLYFERHDGQAVTCDDFLAAMADANDCDLSLFSRWYSQKGTPVVTLETAYDEAAGEYSMRFVQQPLSATENGYTGPLHIPVKMGLLLNDGTEVSLQLRGEEQAGSTTRILELTQTDQSFVFINIPSAPIPSVLRGYSAPIKIDYHYSARQLATLMAYDSDSFARWEAAEQMSLKLMLKLIERQQNGQELYLDPVIVDAFRMILLNRGLDPALAAETLTLPGHSYVGDQMEVIDVDSIYTVREYFKAELGRQMQHDLLTRYKELADNGEYQNDPASIGRRSLRNCCLRYLVAASGPELAEQQLAAADNMTDTLAALTLLTHHDAESSEKALAEFEARWSGAALVMDKWFMIQATAPSDETIEVVRSLFDHPEYNRRNPNKVKALLGSFVQGNLKGFHRADGRSYKLLADVILRLDRQNPQIAARLASAFNRWKRFDETRKAAMKAQLQRLLGSENISPDLYEIVRNALA